MAVRFFWRCEGTTLANSGTDDQWPASGDNTASSSGAPNIGATGAKIGTNGIHTTDGLDWYFFDTTAAEIAQPAEGAIGFWIQFPSAMPGFTADIGVAACGDASLTTNAIRTRFSGTQLTFVVYDTSGGSASVTATGTSLTTATWYFCVLRWDYANDIIRAEVYTGTSETPIASGENTGATLSAPADLVNSSGFRIGNFSSITSVMYFDNLFVADSYDEPLHLNGNRDITAISAYNGSVGSTIVPATLGAFSANAFGSARRTFS